MASDVSKVILKTPPAALKSAVSSVNSGNYAAAIGPLKKIKTDYEMFGPDVTAAQYLAMAYLKMNKPSDASRMCKSVMMSNPDAINNPQFAGVYWDALLNEKKYSTLKRLLGDIIKTGSHETAAVALVKRGDVLMAEGDAKAALLDGYLRTILMFQDVKAIQPEALYKAIKAHQAVNEHNYAEKWRKQLLAGYPSSEYAKKL
jgi:tetratricopeptide (TPR) repeat protein